VSSERLSDDDLRAISCGGYDPSVEECGAMARELLCRREAEASDRVLRQSRLENLHDDSSPHPLNVSPKAQVIRERQARREADGKAWECVRMLMPILRTHVAYDNKNAKAIIETVRAAARAAGVDLEGT